MPNSPIQSPFTIAVERVTLLVGATAFLLPVFLLAISGGGLACDFDSLSHYYYSRFASDWFVGSLVFIGLLMMFLFSIRPGEPGFEGFRKRDRWIMRAAGLAAFLIAFFPTGGTGCEDLGGHLTRAFVELPPDPQGALRVLAKEAVPLSSVAALAGAPEEARLSFNFFSLLDVPPQPVLPEDAPFMDKLRAALADPLTRDQNLHNLGAVVMFSALGYFSLFVFTRKQDRAALRRDVMLLEGTPGLWAAFRNFTFRKQVRNVIYVLAGITIFACILSLIVQSLFFGCRDEVVGDLCRRWNSGNATLKVEWIALWAFALSWLVKGRVIPWLRDPS